MALSSFRWKSPVIFTFGHGQARQGHLLKACVWSKGILDHWFGGRAYHLYFGLGYRGISGLLGGRVDSILMRLVEVLLSIPTFYLMLSLRSVFL